MNYRERNGNTIMNITSQDNLLNTLYSSNWGRFALKVLTKPSVSLVLGKLLSTKLSCLLINPFIKYSKINLEDYKEEQYYSYNDFFTRHIKPEKREINMDKNTLISPCDGKILAYKISPDSTFSIKNSTYTIHTLLKDKKLAKEYNEGYCVIIRLSVEDYHRYCYIDNLKKTKNRHINGILHTVNPIVYDYFKVYKENTRNYSAMLTENFGKIVQMEVGAMFIGRIKNHHKEAGTFKKGQEKGMFEFGGSTIILLLKKDTVELDEDILLNTSQNFETIVKMGEKIGKSK